MLFEATKRFKSNDKAWNHCHVSLIAAAHAHTMFQLVEAFAQGIREAPSSAQGPLGALLRLFALTKLSEVPIHFSRLTGEQGQMIDRAVKKLLAELRPNIIGLIEGFDWSDRQLESLIALKSDDIYEALFDWSKRSPLNKPEYVERIHKEVLSKFLNKEYLAKGNARSKV
jgi:acyl-CoA oxidase